jgi:2-keto-4-pentenoate hydratase/2-oxohepta-3-ene-1,7-dioic acid hydratase in catechol pathway
MKLGTIVYRGAPTPIAQIDARHAASLAGLYQRAQLGRAPASVLELIDAGLTELAKLRQARGRAVPADSLIDVTDADWLAPVTRPSKIFGVAFNNKALTDIAHVRPTRPMFFLKPPSCLTGHNKPILVGSDYGRTIPELELGVVIGRRCKSVTPAVAREHIFGYTIVNDVTSTGLKFQYDSIAIDLAAAHVEPVHVNWRRRRGADDNELYFTYHTRSKGADSFGPMGPWLTTADEVPDPNNLKVAAFADGEPLTADSTANYQFRVEDLVSEASRFFTLEPGDIFTCGTSGAGTSRYPRGHLSLDLSKCEPVVRVEIDGLGALSNPVRHFENRGGRDGQA